MSDTPTPRQAATIAASLRDQRLDVRLGLLTQAEWNRRAAAARERGIDVAAETGR